MLWLMFPAYNERNTLVKILPELHEYPWNNSIKDYKTLIIDDGSTYSTESIPDYLDKALPIQIVSHEKIKVLEMFLKQALLL